VETYPVFLIPITGIPFIKQKDDLVKIILGQLEISGTSFDSGDILVLSQKIVSKAEGAVIALNSCHPSEEALKLARICNKDARLVELILRESKKVLRVGHNLIITEHKRGWVCANAGIDQSNVPKGFVTLLPMDPDRTAREIREKLQKITGVEIAVIIIDSHGRPFRIGSIGVALGSAGICTLVDKRGETDLYGYPLRSTQIALADQVASAASMIMGETNEGIPAVIVRGLDYRKGNSKAQDLIRAKEKDLFR